MKIRLKHGEKSCRVSVVHLVHFENHPDSRGAETLNMLLEFRWEVNCSQHIWQWRYFFPHFFLKSSEVSSGQTAAWTFTNAIGLFRVMPMC